MMRHRLALALLLITIGAPALAQVQSAAYTLQVYRASAADVAFQAIPLAPETFACAAGAPAAPPALPAVNPTRAEWALGDLACAAAVPGLSGLPVAADGYVARVVVTYTDGATATSEPSNVFYRTAPLAVGCPAPVALVSADPAPVAYAPPAASGGLVPVSAKCVPASQAVFPLGATPVACTATDAAGQTAACGFSVTLTAPAGTASFADAFGRPDSPALGNGWVEAQGDVQLRDGALVAAAASGYEVALTPVSGPDVTAAADFAYVAHQGTPRVGLVLRRQNALSYYLLYRQMGGTAVLRIARVLNGNLTVLKSVSQANPAKGVPFRLEARAAGTTLTLALDGVVRLTVTDAAFGLGGVGLLTGSTSTHDHRADNVAASAP